MKIIISKAQWKAIGKIAGWLYHFCSWCGNPIDKSDGICDPEHCDTPNIRCKVKDPTSPEDFETLSDDICADCIKKQMYNKNPEQLPYNINKGKTPKDKCINLLRLKQVNKPIDQQFQDFFHKKLSNCLKSINYR